MICHAGLIALRVGGVWRGALIEGPSGSGKSDLALRALHYGFHLVADDRVLLWAEAGRLYGRAPDVLKGQIEIRGQGVVPSPSRAFCEVRLWVRPGQPERLPDPATHAALDVSVRLLLVDYFENAAPMKLAHALTAFDAAHKRGI